MKTIAVSATFNREKLATRLTESLNDLVMLHETGRIDAATFEEQALGVASVFILAISSRPADQILRALA